ncbi:MAG: M14 family zinc carboxypeptidase, partial [bacterium]
MLVVIIGSCFPAASFGEPGIPLAPGGSYNTHDNVKQVMKRAHNYRELVRALNKIQKNSKGRISTGPLIDRGDNGGLLKVDQDLLSAIINTVQPNNNSLEKIGKSTQGREIMAARFGKEGKPKVMIISQQHGSEMHSTEALLSFLKDLSKGRRGYKQSIFDNLDILAIVRANPDGGEPDEHCFNTDEIPDYIYGATTATGPFAGPDARDCA